MGTAAFDFYMHELRNSPESGFYMENSNHYQGSFLILYRNLSVHHDFHGR